MMWRYSLRWCLPHRPCPGRRELMVKYTVPGAPIPTKIRELWKEYQGQGYGVCIDFPPSKAVQRWSAERKAEARRRKMVKRIEKTAPLFAQELIAREFQKRGAYFNGE
ncbi:TPA: theronine dehydrogenase [Pseudomonas aeruginosa]|nr:theronine dehydrogenase [Pseudomonas aeruginosa]MBH8321105.1 theronine dehydrogenase [Pseudomonas aeruginosa]HBN7636190.1 theronine dehydrogenase [Pseudomonas aeruginosa]HBN8588293.1 theronine dehydrogenase [Pseudomonas aeruginosa]HBN9095835.1 theronine dehydrogenase [Pseudomonas aeruginosa]HBN9378522.1 theronine dehydrogenase [Pseudomonas aeruginosa]